MTQDPARIILSFLNGTSDWQSIGVAAEQNPLLAANGGLNVTIHSADDTNLSLDSVNTKSAIQNKDLNNPSHDVAYTDMFSAGPLTLTGVAGAEHVSQAFNLPAGTVAPVVLKHGPMIARVQAALAEARKRDRPLFVDFTGVYCGNCRAMVRAARQRTHDSSPSGATSPQPILTRFPPKIPCG
jgi:thiol-disulfide isomerase/thioredoxin